MPRYTITISFKSPAAYVQGRGVTEELGDRIEQLGKTALVIGDKVVLGIVEDTVRESLTESGIEPVVEEFEGECSMQEIERITGIAENASADVIVGAGGGKALDTAKAVKTKRGIAMVSMPTIASTDAPTSALSVIYTEDGEFERYWFHEGHPELVLLNTAVVAGGPARFFRSGISNAMATWFEADAVYRAEGENFFGEEPTHAAFRLSKLVYTGGLCIVLTPLVAITNPRSPPPPGSASSAITAAIALETPGR